MIDAEMPTDADRRRGKEWMDRPLSHEDGRLLIDVACDVVEVSDASAELIRIANQIHRMVRHGS